MPEREATVDRETKETQVRVELRLDRRAAPEVDTGVGFLDHMLELFGKHAGVGLSVSAEGDVGVDDHHTVEDVGIALGQAVERALGDRAGIVRFADAAVPMDEALARVALDFSGRGYLVFDVAFPQEKIGRFDAALVREFLQAFASNARLTLHVAVPCGDDAHHVCEAVFKALARAVGAATRVDPRVDGVPSTKGVL
ncbi:MAG: imidazoleglycerol-phosphate dehydratase HisB [Planctomycetota bacterium]